MTRLKESVAQMKATGGTAHEADFDVRLWLDAAGEDFE